MKTIKLALIALAATLTCGAANAEEADKMDVIVVTTTRPDALSAPKLPALEQPMLAIDFSELEIERPTLDPTEIEPRAPRIELALHGVPKPKS
jgi:hypothetical protein